MNPNDKLSDIDIEVLVDMLYERLPAVWHDALIEIQSGKELETILQEMSNGHIVRILRKLGIGVTVDEWLAEFRNFVEGDIDERSTPK